MTTIAMREHADGVTIAFDSRVSWDSHVAEVEYPKVFVTNGVIYGVAGDNLMNNVLRYADLPNPDVRQTLGGSGWDVDRWVNNTLIPAILDALVDRAAAVNENGKVSLDGQLLLVVRNRVYEVAGGTAWTRRVDKTYAIGSGWQFALGALSAGIGLPEALEIAATHDSGTGHTLHIVQAAELLSATPVVDYPVLAAVA